MSSSGTCHKRRLNPDKGVGLGSPLLKILLLEQITKPRGLEGHGTPDATMQVLYHDIFITLLFTLFFFFFCQLASNLACQLRNWEDCFV